MTTLTSVPQLLTCVSVLADVAALEASEDGVGLDGDAAAGHAALLHLGGRHLQRGVARAQHQVVQVGVQVAGGGVQAGTVLREVNTVCRINSLWFIRDTTELNESY